MKDEAEYLAGYGPSGRGYHAGSWEYPGYPEMFPYLRERSDPYEGSDPALSGTGVILWKLAFYGEGRRFF